eukprot:169717_1
MYSLHGFAKIDFALNLYYEQIGRVDYKNEENTGKFIQFTKKHNLNEDEIDDELNKNANSCVYVDFDPNFPLEGDGKEVDDYTKREQILHLIKTCYIYGYPKKHIPLHRFSITDICNKITNWIHNDINYAKYLETTINVFKARKLNGTKISNYASNDIKCIVEPDLKYITSNTLKITFDLFDKYQNENTYDIASKSAEDIAKILYDFPLINFISKIKEKSIDGQKFIDDYVNNTGFIQKVTGFDRDEIYQIRAVLFKEFTYTQKQFILNIDNIFKNKYKMSLSGIVLSKIKKIILSNDVEGLYYNIKNGKSVPEFSDKITKMVENLVQNHNESKDDTFVKNIYKATADCFISHNEQNEKHNISLDKPYDWTCHNCGNYNFNYYVGGQINTDLSTCSLCGMQQIDTIILNLKHQDTFLMVNDDDNNEKSDEQKRDAIDSMIYSVIQKNNFRLQCPNKNNNKPCESILLLARNLVIHNKGNEKIMKQIQINFIKTIDDETFIQLFKESAKLNSRINDIQMNKIIAILKDKSVINKDIFAELGKKSFSKLMRKQIGLSIPIASKLYKTILNKCYLVFGEFISDYTQNIDRDYHHILKVHIEYGNESNVRNTFEFFKTVVHFKDPIIKQCKSLQRREERCYEMNLANTDINRKEVSKMENINIQSGDKTIWKLEKYYIHSQLDIIHSYLVHSDWHRVCQKLSNIDEKTDEKDEESTFVAQNSDKYVTKLSQSNTAKNYKFGIDHSHLHLAPKTKHSSICRELLCNELYPIAAQIFQAVLVKAIKKHKIALTEYKKELICKYYHRKYNILRNE